MYIKKIMGENIGPIKKIQIDLPFKEKCPKPVIIVGENGTGKSTILSNIVDAFYEIAGTAYSDARKQAKTEGYEYYKAITSREIHVGENYLYSYIKFENEESPSSPIDYVFKSGSLKIDDFKEKVGLTSTKISWNDNDNYKKAAIDTKTAEKMISKNIICYFGPDRYEKPFWMGNQYYEITDYEHVTVKERFSNTMELPIMINGMTNKTLQWLLDVIVDSRGDIEQGKDNGLQLVHIFVDDILKQGIARKNIEEIMSNIIGENAYFGLNFRNTHGSRFNIKRKKDNSLIIPSLDALSTGQSALFNMFATIVRYADTINISNSINLSDIKGIVVIDEIELHLHSSLQREVLPKLIALFPKVQFIITTHSPLFLLGMEEILGEDGFEIYQMPQAIKINAERFSEFQKAYTYLTKTQEYEKRLYEEISLKKEKMLVITEGSTDCKHMKAAYNKLSSMEEYKEIFNGLEFEFLEYEPANSKIKDSIKLEMGNKSLCSLCENISKLKQERKMVFIADRDVDDTNKKLTEKGKTYKTWGNNVYSFIIPIPANRTETPNICIEHLYSDEIIKTEVTDKATGIKRRLFMGNEFDIRGISYKLGIMCERKNLCGENKISIIEGSSGERVTKLDNGKINIALSKMAFATMILQKEAPFKDVDFSNFVEIFKILKEIYDKKLI